MNLKYSVREIVESAMLVALAVVLDLQGLKIQLGPNGGSVSFTMVPLFILAIRMGPFKGFVGIGVIYGIITCLLDGWGIQTFPFDYLLAYGSISIIGFFSKQILNEKKPAKSILFLVLGTFLGILLRFTFACLSSMILYEFSLWPSVVYNATYILPSGGVCLVLLLVLYKPLLLINKKFPTKAFE